MSVVRQAPKGRIYLDVLQTYINSIFDFGEIITATLRYTKVENTKFVLLHKMDYFLTCEKTWVAIA